MSVTGRRSYSREEAASPVLLFRLTKLINGGEAPLLHSGSPRVSFERFWVCDILDICFQDKGKIPFVVEKVGFGDRLLVFEFWSVSEVYNL